MDRIVSFIPLIVIWSAVLLFFRINRIKVFYFLWGSIGFTLLAVFMLQGTAVEAFLSKAAISIITLCNRYLSIPVVPFSGAGTILMTGTMISGYTSLEIGTECSGLLELIVFYGLALFYPVFGFSKRMVVLATGTVAIYILNILRVQIIISAVYLGGRDSIFLAHTVLGRGLFFILMVILYWFFFTRSTMFFLNKQQKRKA